MGLLKIKSGFDYVTKEDNKSWSIFPRNNVLTILYYKVWMLTLVLININNNNQKFRINFNLKQIFNKVLVV